MDYLLAIILIPLTLWLALLPSYGMWLLTNHFIPVTYRAKPRKMTFVCFVLAFLTGAILNLDLDGGAASMLSAIMFFSFFWSLLLIPVCLAINYKRRPSTT